MKKYVAYVIYSPTINKETINEDITRFKSHLSSIDGNLGENDIISVKLAYPIDKKLSGELLVMYFDLPQSDNLKHNLSELLRIVDPKHNNNILRYRFLTVDSDSVVHINSIKEYFQSQK